jgi:hypothetical protein
MLGKTHPPRRCSTPEYPKWLFSSLGIAGGHGIFPPEKSWNGCKRALLAATLGRRANE